MLVCELHGTVEEARGKFRFLGFKGFSVLFNNGAEHTGKKSILCEHNFFGFEQAGKFHIFTQRVFDELFIQFSGVTHGKGHILPELFFLQIAVIGVNIHGTSHNRPEGFQCIVGGTENRDFLSNGDTVTQSAYCIVITQSGQERCPQECRTHATVTEYGVIGVAVFQRTEKGCHAVVRGFHGVIGRQCRQTPQRCQFRIQHGRRPDICQCTGNRARFRYLQGIVHHIPFGQVQSPPAVMILIWNGFHIVFLFGVIGQGFLIVFVIFGIVIIVTGIVIAVRDSGDRGIVCIFGKYHNVSGGLRGNGYRGQFKGGFSGSGRFSSFRRVFIGHLSGRFIGSRFCIGITSAGFLNQTAQFRNTGIIREQFFHGLQIAFGFVGHIQSALCITPPQPHTGIKMLTLHIQ